MRRFLMVLAAAAMLGVPMAEPLPARGQTTTVSSEPPGEAAIRIPPTYRRLLRLQAGLVDRSGSRSTWRYYRTEAGGIGEWGQALLTFHREERGDTWDSAIGVDAYVDLWGSAYGNVQYQLSPDHHFLPRHDVFLEYFQPFQQTWVGSLNYRRRNYDGLNLDVFGARLGRYSGLWFTRLSVNYVAPDRTSNGLNATLMVRRYAGNPQQDYLQLYGSLGENVEPLVTGPTRRTFDARSVGMVMRRHLGAGWGLELLLELAETDRLPTRRTVQGGLVWRW